MPAPLFLISSPQNTRMGLSRSEPFITGTLQVLGINFDQPAGLLPPGSSYRIPVHFQAPSTDWVGFRLEQMGARNAPIDWQAVEAEIKPDDADPSEWDPMFAQLKQQIGTTWADYQAAFGRNATRRARYGAIAYDPRILFQEEIEKASEEGGVAILGRVYLAGSGQPVSNAEVMAWQAEGWGFGTGTIDDQGRFAVQFVPPGDYQLQVEGYVLDQELVVSVADQDVFGVELPVQAGGRIGGTVTTDGDEALEGASVTAWGSTGQLYLASSDQTGSYQVIGLPTDVYTVYCDLPMYVEAEQTGVSVTLGATLSGIDFQLELGGAVSGTVTAIATSEALSSTAVIVEQGGNLLAATVTDGEGRYDLSSLRAGTYSVHFVANGYWQAVHPLTITVGQTAQLDAALEEAGRITGVVVDSVAGQPLQGVTVQTMDNNSLLYSSVSDEEGRYEITNLAPGDYWVTVGGTGIAFMAPALVQLSPGHREAMSDFHLSIHGTVSGHALDVEGSTPIGGAVVWLWHEGEQVASAFTEQDGGYSFAVLHPGTYEVWAADAAHGFLPVPGLVITSSTHLEGVDLISGHALLSGLVRDAVTATGIPSATVRITRVISGTLRQPGSYDIIAAAPGYARTTRELLHISPGQTQAYLVLELAAGAIISGVVADTAGRPVPDAFVLIYDHADGSLYGGALSDADGAYTVQSLPPGLFELRAVHEALGLGKAVVTLTQGGQARQDLLLTTGSASVTGTVNDDTGLSLPDADVMVLDGLGRVSAMATSDEHGMYRLAGLEPEAYALQGIRSNHFSGSPYTVTLVSGEVRTGIDLTPRFGPN